MSCFVVFIVLNTHVQSVALLRQAKKVTVGKCMLHTQGVGTEKSMSTTCVASTADCRSRQNISIIQPT